MVRVNDVVQIVPDHKWSGCFVLVTEVKSWGVQGFIQVPMEGQAYIRLQHDEFELVGTAPFIFERNITEEEEE